MSKIFSFFSGIWEGLKATWIRWNEEGIRVPFAHSGASGKPSVTLLLLYISSLAVLASLFLLHWRPSLWEPTAMTIVWWSLSVVFYLMRNLQKFKVDLDDKSIEMHSEKKDEKERS
jgi:hypothetical protein